MAKVVLDCPGVLAVVGELVAAGMPQHVAVDEEREAGSLTSPCDHALIASHAQRRQAFGDERVGAGWSFTLEPAQARSSLPSNRMNAGFPALGAPHVQLAGGKVDIVEQDVRAKQQKHGPANITHVGYLRAATGYYVIGEGKKNPYRVKMRTASFSNVSVIPAVLPGVLIPDLISILGSIFFVVGDVDK